MFKAVRFFSSVGWLILFWTLVVQAQPEMVFTRYGIQDGLPSGNLNSLFEDLEGFIWSTSEQSLTRFDGYRFTTYVRDDNIFPGAVIHRSKIFYEDRTGVLWIPTRLGMLSYRRDTDSVDIAPFHTGNGRNSREFGVSNFVEDADGYFWLSASGRIIRFDPRSRLYRVFPSPRIRQLSESLEETESNISHIIDKDIWLLHEGRIFLFNRVSLQYSEFPIDRVDPALPTDESFEQLQFHGNAMFVLHRRGLYRINMKDMSSEKLCGTVNASVFHRSRNNVVWINDGTDALHKVDLNDRSQKGFKIAQRGQEQIGTLMRKIFESRDGTLWILTDGNGICHLDPRTERMEWLTYDAQNPNSLSSNTVYDIIEDRTGTLWASCRGRGLVKIERIHPMIKTYRIGGGEGSFLFSNLNNVRAFLELSNDSILVGTLNGLRIFSRKTEKFSPVIAIMNHPSGIADSPIGALTRDQFGRVWIGSWTLGKLIYDATGHRTFYLPPETSGGSRLRQEGVRDILSASDGTIWIAKWHGLESCKLTAAGFPKPGEVEQATYYADPNSLRSLSGNFVFTLLEDKDQFLWVGTETGLNRYDPSTRIFRRFLYSPYDESSIGSNNVRSLLQSTSGVIWIGTHGGGLNKFNPGEETFTRYTTDDGLPNNIIYSIEEDQSGNLWLGTHKGLCRFNPSTLTVKEFGEDDGIQNYEYNTGASLRLHDGAMVFGGIGGFNLFHPDRIRNKLPAPSVVVTTVSVLGQNIPFHRKKQLVLSHNQNSLVFEFSALSHYRNQWNQYAYKIEGIDPDWVFPGPDQYARYTNLAPGTYVFRVKASNCEGEWNEEGAVLMFTITPPWYGTTLAYVGYVIVLGLIVLTIDRFQRRRLIGRERHRAEIQQAELRAEAAEAWARAIAAENQKNEVELQKASELEKAYNALKNTQAQLIQQEKMASLGQLTAGIAHEIKNPLNFIKNFAHLSEELIDEFIEAKDDEKKREIGDLLKMNLFKVMDHGNRADHIVRSMMQHARTGSVVKEEVHLNAALNESLVLSYHSVKAQIDTFNLRMEKKFDESNPVIMAVPQDLGHVFLNIIQNALYAMHQKSVAKLDGYIPVICVSTTRKENSVIIRIRDNGTGIPQHVLDRVFQPFFTTKPSGEGTGLGLSISFDIIVQQHGGSLEVESEENEYTEFRITLPVL